MRGICGKTFPLQIPCAESSLETTVLYLTRWHKRDETNCYTNKIIQAHTQGTEMVSKETAIFIAC